MIARTSAKSRLMSPGIVMMSLIPWTPCRRTSSTTRKASRIEVSFWTTSLSRSFGTVIRVSTWALSSSAALLGDELALVALEAERLGHDADRERALLLRELGHDRGRAGPGTATEPGRDEHHVGVGERLGDLLGILFRGALADGESPPAPRPRVILSPIRILCGASDWSSAWASVLQAMNSTPIISARIIRLTALFPPPPTPMTLMSAKFSESERSGMASPPAALEGQYGGTTTVPDLAAGSRHALVRDGREYTPRPPAAGLRRDVGRPMVLPAGISHWCGDAPSAPVAASRWCPCGCNRWRSGRAGRQRCASALGHMPHGHARSSRSDTAESTSVTSVLPEGPCLVRSVSCSPPRSPSRRSP